MSWPKQQVPASKQVKTNMSDVRNKTLAQYKVAPAKVSDTLKLTSSVVVVVVAFLFFSYNNSR